MLLARPTLMQKVLRAATEHSLTTVVAPMGYGKTTLARSLIEALPDNAHYYAVPAGPHDRHFVWHDMRANFDAQKLDISFARRRRIGIPETASQAGESLEILRGLGRQDAPVYLILDDYHHMTDPLFDAFWERAARENIPYLHIILLSRTRPGVNLEELCLKGHAVLFEQNLLAFSQEETETFFRENGLDDPAAAVESQRYSEGWAAALWLCLQSWRRSGGIAASGDIDSLLSNAVFATYSPNEQDLLMRLSVFESFTEDDAETIAAEADWLPVGLMELRRKSAFLSFDERTEFYQFHSIFRDFLRKRLAATAHIDKPALYRLAGERCFTRHNHVAALRFFQKAGRDEDLRRLLDASCRFAEDRNLFYFVKERFSAASAIPWRIRLQAPLGWLSVVVLHALTGDDRRVVSLLDETEERFRAAEEIPESMKQRLQGEIEVVRAFLALNAPDRMLSHYNEAVRLLNGPSRFVSEDFPWNCGSPNLSFVMVRDPGSYGELPEQAAELLRLYNTLSGGKTQNAEKLLRAENLLERGDFSGAEPLLTDALAKCGDDDRQLMTALLAAFGLVRARVANGDAESSAPMLEALQLRAETRDLAGFFDGIDIIQGYANAVLGRLEGIPSWLRDGEIFDPPHNAMPQIFGIGLTIHGKALLLQGEHRRLEIVARKIPGASPLVNLFARIHGKILQSLAVWHTQGQREALDLLEEALDLTRPDGLVLIPAEYGGHILPLLRRIRQNRPDAEKDDHLDATLALASRIARAADSPGRARKDLLTPREREILRHVAKGETNPAIADQLNISINAVKSMLSKASVKLGAFNRLDAANRFNEMYNEANS